VSLSLSILLLPAVFVVVTCTMSFHKERGQLTNAVSVGGMVSSLAVAVALAEPACRVGFYSMVDLWTERLSSISFVVMELRSP
jgi:hypothetical protein